MEIALTLKARSIALALLGTVETDIIVLVCFLYNCSFITLIIYFSYVDIDECINVTSPCPIHSFCVNTLGNYECNCSTGYTKIGDACEGTNQNYLLVRYLIICTR